MKLRTAIPILLALLLLAPAVSPQSIGGQFPSRGVWLWFSKIITGNTSSNDINNDLLWNTHAFGVSVSSMKNVTSCTLKVYGGTPTPSTLKRTVPCSTSPARYDFTVSGDTETRYRLDIELSGTSVSAILSATYTAYNTADPPRRKGVGGGGRICVGELCASGSEQAEEGPELPGGGMVFQVAGTQQAAVDIVNLNATSYKTLYLESASVSCSSSCVMGIYITTSTGSTCTTLTPANVAGGNAASASTATTNCTTDPTQITDSFIRIDLPAGGRNLVSLSDIVLIAGSNKGVSCTSGTSSPNYSSCTLKWREE